MADAYNSVSRTVQGALTEYSDAFKSALAIAAEEVTSWATDLGMTATSNAIKTIYPFPIFAAGYHEFKGEIKYRSLYDRQISMRGKQWQDGVTEKAAVIEAGDFMGWGEQPAAMALEARRLPNTIVAAMLASNSFAGPALEIYRNPDDSSADIVKALFASDHRYNVLDASVGTFDNTDIHDALDDDFLTEQKEYFRGLKGPNGQPLGLRMTHLLVPASLEEQARKLLESDILVEAVLNGSTVVGGVGVANRHKGTVTLVVADELQEGTNPYVYALALNKPGMKPWIVQTTGAAEELVRDKESDYYKTTLKVSIAHVIDANVGAAFPQAIRRIEIDPTP
jgi:phage major head subunit gpT-like protein